MDVLKLERRESYLHSRKGIENNFNTAIIGFAYLYMSLLRCLLSTGVWADQWVMSEFVGVQAKRNCKSMQNKYFNLSVSGAFTHSSNLSLLNHWGSLVMRSTCASKRPQDAFLFLCCCCLFLFVCYNLYLWPSIFCTFFYGGNCDRGYEISFHLMQNTCREWQ